MPIRTRYHLNEVDRARFQVHAAAFERYLNEHRHHRVQVGERNHERMEEVEFDDAEVTYVVRYNIMTTTYLRDLAQHRLPSFSQC